MLVEVVVTLVIEVDMDVGKVENLVIYVINLRVDAVVAKSS